MRLSQTGSDLDGLAELGERGQRVAAGGEGETVVDV
jgi:hypothetical protein